MYASAKRQPTVKTLLEAGANVKAAGQDGTTSLMLAGEGGIARLRPPAPQYKGADPMAVDSQGLTATDMAIGSDQKALIEILTIAQKPLIAALQQTLVDIGFDPGPVDGIIGQATKRALESAKKSYGINEKNLFLVTKALDSSAQKGLRFCNACDVPMSLAYGLESKVGIAVISGWYNIEPGDCFIPETRDLRLLKVTRLFSRAQSSKGGWGGDRSGCVAPQNAFEYRMGDPCRDLAIKQAGYFENDLTGQTWMRERFTCE